jgi:polyphenol oxidase
VFLYQTQLGGIATVSVTHNLTCLQQPYAANLALHVKDSELDVMARRHSLEFKINKPIQWLNQVHGIDVYLAGPVICASPIADAAITQHSEVALAVMSADCLPVVLSAKNASGQRAVGVAHAGWRGLLNGVIDQTVIALTSAVPNAELHAHLGPCIGLAQFEVSQEVYTAFTKARQSSMTHFYAKSNNKYLCDLTGLARDSLNALGVTSLTGGGWCTASDPRLTSYRRQAITGRFATLVALI